VSPDFIAGVVSAYAPLVAWGLLKLGAKVWRSRAARTETPDDDVAAAELDRMLGDKPPSRR